MRYTNKTATKHFFLARYYYRDQPPSERVYHYIGDSSRPMDNKRSFWDTTDINQAATFVSISRAKIATKSPSMRPNKQRTINSIYPARTPVWEFIKIEETIQTSYSLEVAQSTASPLEQLAQAAQGLSTD